MMSETSIDLKGRSNVAYQRKSSTAWRTIAEETIVVDLTANEFFGLNETGAAVWNALDGSIGTGELAGGLGIDPKQVGDFCAELVALGLIETGEESGNGPDGVPAEKSPGSIGSRPEEAEPPRIVWREEIRQVAASCAFNPAVNPLCNQAPFS